MTIIKEKFSIFVYLSIEMSNLFPKYHMVFTTIIMLDIFLHHCQPTHPKNTHPNKKYVGMYPSNNINPNITKDFESSLGTLLNNNEIIAREIVKIPTTGRPNIP